MRPRVLSPRPLRKASARVNAVRVGPLAPLPSLLRDFGIDPPSVLIPIGVDPALLDNPENWIPTRKLGVLLDVCGKATSCEHFSLLIAERFTLSSFGALGYLMRHSETLLDALRALVVHVDLQDRASVTLMLDRKASKIALGYTLIDPAADGRHAVQDGVVAILTRVVAELCGPTWRPLAVTLSRPRPTDTSVFARAFGCIPKFNADCSAVIFDSRWLAHPIEGADANLRQILARTVEFIEANESMRFDERVRRAVRAMILTSIVSSAGIAHFFDMPQRTFRRRLSDEGTTFRKLVNDERRRLAQDLLRNTGLPVAAVSSALHYSNPVAFARAFRRDTKASPRQWRKRIRR